MKNNLIENRHIRVFISSTFQDMQEERDYLMKKTFPKLRRIALNRNVTLTEVDLRWGITKEEAESGKVVEICLREIENSNPFFVGIIGNRYGWIPSKNDIDDEVIHLFNPVERYLNSGLSVTEMEIQYGVLERDLNPHAYFFLKDYKETSSDSEMLHLLKEKVKNSVYPYFEYQTIEQLGEEVEKCFIQLLDFLYPIGVLSENEYQKIFQTSTLNQLSLFYYNKNNHLQFMDRWLSCNHSNEILLSGSQGIGKSALVANWIKNLRNSDNWNTIYVFLDKFVKTPNKENIIKYIKSEITSLYNIDININDYPLNGIFEKIESFGQKKLVLVLDGLNYIDNHNDKLLNWMNDIPENVKVIYSTLKEDITYDILKRRDVSNLELDTLAKSEIEEISIRYLQLYGKTLTFDQISYISNNKIFSNPLILKSILNELIHFGNFENLDERIRDLTSYQTSIDFYQKILHYLEEDYGYDFVKYVLSLIVLSRKGLYENDILAIINKFSEIQYPPLLWSQLYNSFMDELILLEGRIVIDNPYLLRAINERYLNNETNVEWKKLISSYIWSYSNEILSQGNVKDLLLTYFLEGPYQAININDQEAAEILNQNNGNPQCIATMFKYDENLTIKCLIFLQQNGFDIEQYFYDEIDSGDVSINIAMINSLIYLAELFEFNNAINFLRIKLSKYSENKSELNSSELAVLYCEMANGLSQGSENEFKRAFNLYIKAIELLNGERCHALSIAYNGLALLILNTNQVIEVAEDLISKALDINKEIFGENHLEIAVNYNTFGRIELKKGNIEKAETRFNQSLDIIKAIYGQNSPYLLVPLYNLSLMLENHKLWHLAKYYVEEALRIINEEMNGIYSGLEDFLKIYQNVNKNIEK